VVVLEAVHEDQVPIARARLPHSQISASNRLTQHARTLPSATDNARASRASGGAEQQELIGRYQREADDATADARAVVFGFFAYPEPPPHGTPAARARTPGARARLDGCPERYIPYE
jgi:hypothetical protein